MFYLTRADIEPLANMADAIAVLEDAFSKWGKPGAFNLERRRMPRPGGKMAHILGGGAPGGGYFGIRTTGGGIANTILLFSEKAGGVEALIDCSLISELRTGAASGVATKLLARQDARQVGIIGSGKTAFRQLEAVCSVRPIDRIRLLARNEEKRRQFAERSAKGLNVMVEPVMTAEQAIRDADIVITATNSPEPVFDGRWLAKGTHINAIGANALNRREVDDTTVLGAAIVAIDHRDQGKIEAGAIARLVDSGRLAWEQVSELGDIVQGKQPRRTDPRQITLFHSLGIGFEDVAYASILLERAKAAGLGQRFG